jgi:hypothetical protein
MIVVGVKHCGMQCSRHDVQAVGQLVHFGADGA